MIEVDGNDRSITTVSAKVMSLKHQHASVGVATQGPWYPQSKVIFGRFRQLLAINAYKMAPSTGQWLQERVWDAPTKGLLWPGDRGGCQRSLPSLRPIMPAEPRLYFSLIIFFTQQHCHPISLPSLTSIIYGSRWMAMMIEVAFVSFNSRLKGLLVPVSRVIAKKKQDAPSHGQAERSD